MHGLFAGIKKIGRCTEVAVSGGSTVFQLTTTNVKSSHFNALNKGRRQAPEH